MKKILKKWLGIEALEVKQSTDDSSLREKIAFELKAIKERLAELDMCEPVRMNSRMEFILGALSAIEKKLGKIEWYWEDDPAYMPPEPQKRRAWRISEEKEMK